MRASYLRTCIDIEDVSSHSAHAAVPRANAFLISACPRAMNPVRAM